MGSADEEARRQESSTERGDLEEPGDKAHDADRLDTTATTNLGGVLIDMNSAAAKASEKEVVRRLEAGGLTNSCVHNDLEVAKSIKAVLSVVRFSNLLATTSPGNTPLPHFFSHSIVCQLPVSVFSGSGQAELGGGARAQP